MNKPHFLPPLALLAALVAVPASAPLAAPAHRPAARAAAKPVPPASAAVAGAPVKTGSAAALAGPQAADYIVAVVNSEPVTNHEVRARAAQVRRALERQNAPVPPDARLHRDVLESLITERAQLQQARDEGIKVDDDALRQAELAIARQNEIASVEELERRIQSEEGIPVQDFRADLRRQVLITRLRERVANPAAVKVSDAEVNTFLREQTGQSPGGATQAMQLNVAMILIAVPESASRDDIARLQARASEVARRAGAGEDFAALAREYSDASDKNDGGVLGLRPASGYPDLFVRALAQAQAGGVAGPVRSAAGFHVLKLLERKQTSDLPDMAVPQTRVSQILLRTSSSQTEQAVRERLADFKRRIASGQTSFEALARQYSQAETAREGGDMGWIVTQQLPPDLAQIIDGLAPGQISAPIVTPNGVSLLRVEERRQQMLNADQQRQLARNILRERRAQESFDTWAREVRDRAGGDRKSVV
jgi:peptidyl-prolyl cis-trans isomerase SurA